MTAISRRTALQSIGVAGFSACITHGALAGTSKSAIRPSMMVEAHRGYSALYPENTLLAVEKALEIGADRVEVDVHITADGHLVLLHDDTMDRTTNGKGKIWEWPFEKVRQLDAGSWMNERFKGLQIPTLKETLACVRGKGMLDLDVKSDRAIPQMVREIKEAGMVHSVIITGCNEEWASLVRHEEPRLSIFWEPSAKYKTVDADPKADLTGTVIDGALEHQFRGFCYEDTLVSETFLRRAHELGLSVLAWTIDDPSRIEELIAWGVDGIMTNEPARVLELL